MKFRKFAILLLALLSLTALMGSAFAGTKIDTDAASLEAANQSEAAAGQSGTVDGVISFDYNGKTYVYYHMNDGGSGYFLPVTYMQEALDAAFSLETPSEAVQGYQRALESAMNTFLGNTASANDTQTASTPAATEQPAVADDPFASAVSPSTGTSSTPVSTSNSSSSANYVEDKDDPYGALSNGGKSSSKKNSTPELGDESAPLYVLLAVAAVSMAGMLYARKRSMEM